MNNFEKALADMREHFDSMQDRQDNEHAETLDRMKARTAEFVAKLKGE